MKIRIKRMELKTTTQKLATAAPASQSGGRGAAADIRAILPIRRPSGIRQPRSSFQSPMADTPPIACTLSAADLEDREGAWKKLMGSRLVERTLVPGGVRLHAAPGAAYALIDLVGLERECLACMHFEGLDPSVLPIL